MNPQGNGQFLVNLTRSLGPHVQVEAVLTIGSLVAIAPLGGIEAGIMDGLIAGMTELVAQAHTFPCHHRLGFLPAQIANRRSGIGNTTIDIHARILCLDTLNLTTLNGQHGVGLFLFLRGGTRHHCQQRQYKE